MFFDSPQRLREKGKSILFKNNKNDKQISKAVKLIKKAAYKNDIEATYLYTDLVIKGYDGFLTMQRKERALATMLVLADNGYTPARVYLDKYSNDQYTKQNIADVKKTSGPLVDFYGIPIEVKKAGKEIPIDAVLEYKNGQNIFTLSANVRLDSTNEIKDQAKFKKAVLEGMKAWQGEYTVFGGQKVTVRVELTTYDRDNDNIYVIPVTPAVRTVMKMAAAEGSKEGQRALNALLNSRRSFFLGDGEWRVNGQKRIFLQFHGDVFDNYKEVIDTVKHEFGHAIGLGDLYPEQEVLMNGVERGNYKELDSYYVTEKIYNLVMCDYHGPISNNDIEMVILAFRTNRAQLYQSKNGHGVASNALGRGN